MLTPISDIIGNVRLWPLEAHFEPITARLASLNLTATALKHWKLKGFTLPLENITLEVIVGHTFHSTLLGRIFVKAHPISFRIKFPSPLPNVLEMKMGFQEFPDTSLMEIGRQLLSGFRLGNLFPPIFDKLQISMQFLNLRLLPPLRQLQMLASAWVFPLKIKSPSLTTGWG